MQLSVRIAVPTHMRHERQHQGEKGSPVARAGPAALSFWANRPWQSHRIQKYIGHPGYCDRLGQRGPTRGRFYPEEFQHKFLPGLNSGQAAGPQNQFFF